MYVILRYMYFTFDGYITNPYICNFDIVFGSFNRVLSSITNETLLFSVYGSPYIRTPDNPKIL